MEVTSKNITFGSVCSGIEAASVAWTPLGFKGAWFSEIEPFPCRVLTTHWPLTPNYGDMNTLAARLNNEEIQTPDILIGGTPCQAFSLSGKRKGLADPRGQLTLSFVCIADALDSARKRAGEKESVIVWENVTGVLNSADNAFGCFLGAMAGENRPLHTYPAVLSGLRC
ncbi:DNA cytosine methyltransferase [Erwinia tracheiphila]|uniref:DNA cytosine methyltransferase n=1 Tax=Erwinia tracheiphila TaxID=65700 RepID=A0A345CSK6_9GAMM|nr:DNA cytosine methyltransferase [Erwinia tracheiphila]